MRTCRYSPTRYQGATCTAATKISEEDHEALHLIAVESGISDYEAVRRAVLRYIQDPFRSGT